MEPAERHRAAEEARAFFQRVGAEPLVRRLDAAIARWPTVADPRASARAGETVATPM
jgi:hypothetical protein